MSQCVPPWAHPAWDSLCFLDLVDYFFSHVREVYSYFSGIFSGLFSLSSLSVIPIMQILVCLMLFQRSFRLASFIFILFSIFCSWQWFPPFCPPGHLSMLQLFCYGFLLVYYSSLVCLFFSSFRSVVDISCIISIFTSILFPRSWIIFTIIILIIANSKGVLEILLTA